MVDFTAVADVDHPDGHLGILYRINNAVIPLANAVLLLAGELFTTNGARILGILADNYIALPRHFSYDV
jgi:hypothetical protein